MKNQFYEINEPSLLFSFYSEARVKMADIRNFYEKDKTVIAYNISHYLLSLPTISAVSDMKDEM